MPQIHHIKASSCSQSSRQIYDSLSGMHVNDENASGDPELVLVIKPVSKMRFRYQTEKGSHGVLTGFLDPSVKRKKKVYPVVQLKNYAGKKAVYLNISLYTLDENKPHVLYLYGKDCEEGICRVKFSNDLSATFQVSIGSRKKEDVLDILRERKEQTDPFGNDFETESVDIEEEVKNFNQNAAKLCFEAYVEGDPCRPICRMFSDAIYNSKSTETGDLKICRLSKVSGSCSGGDEIFLFCDKVKKENVKVRFYEEKNGEVVWEDYGTFNLADWHHQVALAFKTPAYRENEETKVWIELLRTTDGAASEPREFHYIPNEIDLARKRRRIDPPSDNLSSFNVSKPLEHVMNSPQSSPASSISTEYQPILNNDVNFNPGLSYGKSYQDIFQSSDPVESLDELLDSDIFEWMDLPAMTNFEEDFSIIAEAQMATDTATKKSPEAQIGTRAVPKRTAVGQMGTDAVAIKFSSLRLTSEQEAYQNEAELRSMKTLPDSLKLNIKEAVRDAFRKGNIKSLLRFSFKLMPLQDRNGDTLLHLAAVHQAENLDFISELLEFVPDHIFNHQNKRKKTPLHIATENNRQLLLKLLLLHGASPLVPDSVGDTCIHIACKRNSDKTLKELLSRIETPAELSMSNHEGLTPLHICVIQGAEKCLHILTSFKADVNVIDKKTGRTPLHFAIEAPLPILKYLLSQPGVDKTAKDFSGRTVFDYADDNGSKEHKILLEGALASSCELNSNPPKDLEMSNTSPEILKRNSSCHSSNEDSEFFLTSAQVKTLCKLMDPPHSGWRSFGMLLEFDDQQCDSTLKLNPESPTKALLKKFQSSYEGNRLEVLKEMLIGAGLSEAAATLNVQC